MVHLLKIDSLDLPELAPYRTLKRSAEHEALGIFVVEGDKVLHRLLESEFTVVSVLLVEERLAEFEPLLQARPEKEIAVFVCRKPVMTALAGFEIYQGVLAIGKIPAAVDAGKNPRNQPASAIFCRDGRPFQCGKCRHADAQLRGFWRPGAARGRNVQQPVSASHRPQFDGRAVQAASAEIPRPRANLARIAQARHPVHRRASAHKQKVFVPGGFHRRLLHRLRQRRPWHFRKGSGRV